MSWLGLGCDDGVDDSRGDGFALLWTEWTGEGVGGAAAAARAAADTLRVTMAVECFDRWVVWPLITLLAQPFPDPPRSCFV